MAATLDDVVSGLSQVQQALQQLTQAVQQQNAQAGGQPQAGGFPAGRQNRPQVPGFEGFKNRVKNQIERSAAIQIARTVTEPFLEVTKGGLRGVSAALQAAGTAGSDFASTSGAFSRELNKTIGANFIGGGQAAENVLQGTQQALQNSVDILARGGRAPDRNVLDQVVQREIQAQRRIQSGRETLTNAVNAQSSTENTYQTDRFFGNLFGGEVEGLKSDMSEMRRAFREATRSVKSGVAGQ